MVDAIQLEEEKFAKFRENADKQRKKIQQLKVTEESPEDQENTKPVEPELEMEFDEPEQAASKVEKLSVENLARMDGATKQAAKKKPKSRKGGKPAWAKTEKQQEEDKEAEIDALLEFAYDLDYDQYLEDFEVRQAFEVIRERVTEIKQDQDWKEKLADEWNKTLEDGQPAKKDAPAEEKAPELRSVYSYSKYHHL